MASSTALERGGIGGLRVSDRPSGDETVTHRQHHAAIHDREKGAADDPRGRPRAEPTRPRRS